MIIRFTDQAAAELRQAKVFLEDQRVGLGDVFAEVVAFALEQIAAAPAAWPSASRRARHYLIRRFRYAVVYQIRGDEIVILAIAHTSRRPGYWRDR